MQSDKKQLYTILEPLAARHGYPNDKKEGNTLKSVKNFKKRSISFVLAVLMLFSVFATDGAVLLANSKEGDAAQNGDPYIESGVTEQEGLPSDAPAMELKRYVSHSENLTDDGVKITDYAESVSVNDVIKVPGASSLTVTVEYGSGNGDWACVWEGNRPEYTASNDYASSLSGKLGGDHGTYTCTVIGDTVTFAFTSDESENGDGFGYFAVIDARMEDDKSGSPAWHLEKNGEDTYALVFDEPGPIRAFTSSAEVLDRFGGNMESVTEIRLHKGTTQIWTSAFAGLDSIKTVTAPKGSKLNYIDSYAFDGCTGLTDVSISGERLILDSNAFYGCKSLKTVSISGDGTFIGNSAFRDVQSLKTVTVTGEGTALGSNAFYNCASLAELNVESWNLAGADLSYTFYGCTALKLDVDDWDVSEIVSMDHTFYMGPKNISFGEPSGLIDEGAADDISGTADPHAAVTPSAAADMAVGGTCYALWYSASGELVFRQDNTPDASRGTATNTYTVNTSTSYSNSVSSNTRIPWYSIRTSVKKVIFADTIVPTKIDNWFFEMTSLTEIENMENLDVSNVTSMQYTFYSCYRIEELDLSSWDTAKVSNMSSLFTAGPRRIIFGSDFKFVSTGAIDASYWVHAGTGERYASADLIRSYDGGAMAGTYTWDGLGVGGFCFVLQYPGYELVFQTTPVPENEAVQPQSIYIFNTSKAYDNTSNYADPRVPWYSNRSSITKVKFRDEIYPTLTTHWFSGMTKLTGISGGEMLDTSNTTGMSHMFSGCSALTELDLSVWDLTKVQNFSYTFQNCSSLTEIKLGEDYDLSAVTNMSNTFYGCSRLVGLDTSGWSLSSLTNMSYTFYGCSELAELDVSGWNPSKVTSLSYAFFNCQSLSELALGGWDMPLLTSLSYAFYNCYALTELDISGWQLPMLTNMSYAFYGCHSLTVLDLSGWATASVKYMTNALSNAARRIIFGESFVFSGTDAIEPSFWLREGTDEIYESAELAKIYNGSMAGAYSWTDLDVGGGFFALLYESGEMVFQKTKEPEPDRGTLTAVYPVNSSIDYTSTAGETQIPWFGNRTSVKKVVLTFALSPVSMSYWFYGMTNLTEIESIELLDTSAVTSLFNTFDSCAKLKELDVSHFRLSNLTTLANAFYGCTALTGLDASGWGLENVTTLANAFRGCTSLAFLDMSGWTLEKVTTLTYAFYDCRELTWLNTGDWTLSSLTNMSYAFRGCSKLITMDTEGWEMSHVTTLTYAFYGCSSLTWINTSGWVLSAATDMSYAFYGCTVLDNIATGSWGLGNVTTLNYTFQNCAALRTLDVRNWNLSKVSNMSSTFLNCAMLDNLDTSNWVMSKVTSLSSTFSGCSSLKRLSVENWDLAALTTLSSTFSSCTSLTELDVSGWNTSKVTSISYTFNNCALLTDLDTSGWDMAKVTSISYAFYGCKSLTSLDVSGWTLSALTSMAYAFYGCSGLTELDVSDWNTSKVTTISYAFYNCSGLTSLDVSGWAMSAVTNMSYAFYGCKSLSDIDVSHWNTSNVTTVAHMFNGCTSLTSLDVSGWNTSRVTNSSTIYDTSLLEITLGPNVDVGKYSIIYFGGTSTRWVEKGTDTIMTADELRAQHRANPRVATYYRVRTITFDPNGGIAVPNSISEWWPGKKMEALPTATRRGAYFGGWWTELVGGEQLLDGENPTQGTYYAHWDEYEYTLILSSNDQTYRTVEVPLEFNEIYALSGDIFDRQWYVITGWNTLADGSGTQFRANEEVLQLTEIDGDTVYLYAQWTSLDNIVVVTFDSQGGTALPSYSMERGKAIGTLPIPSKAGYSFQAWHLGDLDGEVVTPKTLVMDNIVLVAEWVLNPTVTFDYNVGMNSLTFTRVVPYNTAVGELPDDIYSGRYGALVGWFTEPSGGRKITERENVTYSVTYYAHWGWRPRFNANGGYFTSNSVFPAQEDPNYTITEFPSVESDGYRLVGWFLADGITEVHEGDVVDLSHGSEIIARWERDNTVRITIVPDGGSIEGSTGTIIYEVFSGQPVGELPIPTRSGYEFLGWEDVTGGVTGYCDRYTVFDRNATLFARWAPKNCTVTFDGVADDVNFYNSPGTTKNISVPSGRTINSLPGCYRQDYTLEGWYTEPDGGGTKLTKETVITENVTYYAHWVPFLTTDTSNMHEYTFGVEWLNASNSNVDNQGNNLDFHPANNAQQTAQLHIYFELNNAYGQTNTLPTGSVYFRIPKYVFEDADGNGVGTNNIETWLTEYPNTGSLNFSYIDDGDYYYLVNNQPIDTVGFEMIIEYTVTPNQVQGGAIDDDGRYVDGYEYYQKDLTILFAIDEDPDDNVLPQSWTERELSIEMHTKVDTYASKSFSTFAYNWRKEWGEKPADADDYFYIIWLLTEDYYSSTNQASTFTWSEDNTVHDGTVVYMSKPNGSHSGDGLAGYGNNHYGCVVVTRHHKDLLDDIPPTGRTFYNEAIVTETWESGYETQHRVSAEAVLYSDEYPDGEFDKDRDRAYKKDIDGGQEDILDDHKEITMYWELEYDGGSNERPKWDEETQTYYARNRTIRIRDGVAGKDVMYSSGRAASPYIWEPETSNIYLSDDDYYFTELTIELTEYDAICRNDVWTAPIPVEDLTRYEGFDIYIRRQYEKEFTYFEHINYSGITRVTLPKGTVGFEIHHSTEFYSTEIFVDATMKLVPTQKIMALVQNDVDARTTSIFKNRAVCDIWFTDEGEDSTFFHSDSRKRDFDYALDDLYELNISKTTQHTVKYAGKVRTDAANGIQDVPMVIGGYNDNSSGRLKRLKSGEFYDLLPAGTSVDPSTIICLTDVSVTSGTANYYDNYLTSSSRLDTAYYDVRFYNNWQNSGRTMMYINVAVPDDVSTSRITVLYLLRSTFENIRLNGTTLNNDVAFINTTQGRVWPNSVSGGIAVLPQDDREFYEDLLTQNDGFIGFAQASANYQNPAAYSWGFSKTVNASGAYVVSDATTPGKYYTYRMEYSQSSSNSSKNVVLYDVLEQGARRRDSQGNPTDPIKSDWQGCFESIKVVTTFEGEQEAAIAPKVYYSTVPREYFNLEPVVDPSTYALCDLTNENYWSTTMPEDKSLITAIAVDFSKDEQGNDFTIIGKGIIEVYITMRAPYGDDIAELEENATAYNEGVIYARQGQAASVTPLYSDAQVTLKDVDPGLEKSSDPKSGTEEEPTIVEQDQQITYTLKITNPEEELTLYDIVVEDEIPEGLHVLASEIIVHFGNMENAMKVSQSPRVSLEPDGQKLTFTISSLLPGESMYLEIPVIVTVTKAVFKNSAKITEVDGIKREIKSETTYHEVVPSTEAYLQIAKVVDGRISPIEKGEFTFVAELVAIDGSPVSDEIRKEHTHTGSTLGASGWVPIGPIKYDGETENHVYRYRITEIPGTDEHIEYASTVVYAEVTISDLEPDDEQNVYLIADITYFDENNQKLEGVPTIVNKYLRYGEAVLELNKRIDGAPKTISEGEFTFLAVQVDNVTLEAVENAPEYHGATTGEGGRVLFDPILFSQDSIGKKYTYRITEVKGAVAGIEYSKEVLYAEVEIGNGDGEDLEIRITYFTLVNGERVETENPTITNKFAELLQIPSTGGAGTYSLTIGALLILFPVCMLLCLVYSQARKSSKRLK